MDELEKIVRARLERSRESIAYAMHMADMGNPFAGETDARRREERLQSKIKLTPHEAEIADRQVRALAEEIEAADNRGAERLSVESVAARRVRTAEEADEARDFRERIWGDTVDFVSVSFLERGAQVSRSVGRVATLHGRRAIGSGVLIGEGLFLTNHHVIESPAQCSGMALEFDYERDLDGRHKEVSRFTLDPTLFVFDPVDGLDFTLVGVGPRLEGPHALAEFGVSVLSDARDKHMIGEFANIVQHPRGRMKEVVLRENRLVNRYADALHYVADTEPGSSGSPVYNSEWKMIALHHWGGPWREGRDGDPNVNEGIRISSIVRKLQRRLRFLPASMQERIAAALDFSETTRTSLAPSGAQPPAIPSHGPQIGPDGSLRLVLPIEISLRLPSFAAPSVPSADVGGGDPTQAVKTDPAKLLAAVSANSAMEDYTNRRGYDPDFLGETVIPLPRLAAENLHRAAKRIDDPSDAPRHELTYTHFSVVMNAERRLAFLTACNIDGRSAKSIHRKTRLVTDLEPTARGLRETIDGLEDAEGDSWSHDPRLHPADCAGPEVYEKQIVAGHLDPRSRGRIQRMFQKGHLVRRLDPAWGDEATALEAELDTFHWTNAAPQVGFFNQGTADPTLVGTGKGKLWRAAENYVLRNAVAEKRRVTSFTGPIFRDDDPPYRDIQIPREFYKICAWTETGTLRAVAMVLDQSRVLEVMPERLAEGAEGFIDDLDRVDDFLTTVVEVENATGIDFGEAVRAGDVRTGRGRAIVAENARLGDDFEPRERPRSRRGRPRRGTRREDLTRINGLGPRFAEVLRREGVQTFAEIAAWTDADIARFGEITGAGDRIVSEDWVGQAAGIAQQGDRDGER